MLSDRKTHSANTLPQQCLRKVSSGGEVLFHRAGPWGHSGSLRQTPSQTGAGPPGQFLHGPQPIGAAGWTAIPGLRESSAASPVLSLTALEAAPHHACHLRDFLWRCEPACDVDPLSSVSSPHSGWWPSCSRGCCQGFIRACSPRAEQSPWP